MGWGRQQRDRGAVGRAPESVPECQAGEEEGAPGEAGSRQPRLWGGGPAARTDLSQPATEAQRPSLRAFPTWASPAPARPRGPPTLGSPRQPPPVTVHTPPLPLVASHSFVQLHTHLLGLGDPWAQGQAQGRPQAAPGLQILPRSHRTSPIKQELRGSRHQRLGTLHLPVSRLPRAPWLRPQPP